MEIHNATDVRVANATAEYVAGVQAPNRDELTAYARGFIGLGMRPTDSPPFLRVVLPCGNVREWLDESAVPGKSIECRCGDLDYPHFFIRYTEQVSEPDQLARTATVVADVIRTVEAG